LVHPTSSFNAIRNISASIASIQYTMAILSDIASTVKDIRLVPPTEDETSSQKENDKSQQSQQRRPLLEITSYDRFTPPVSTVPSKKNSCGAPPSATCTRVPKTRFGG
jgi:hypothetical protein